MRELVSLRKLIQSEGFDPENTFVDPDDVYSVDDLDDVEDDTGDDVVDEQ